MGHPRQDPSVPAARVEFPAELLGEEAPPVSPRLEGLKKLETRKIGRDEAPESGLGGAIGATLFVVALLLGAFLLMRKLLGRSRLFASGSSMRVLARRPIAPRQEVILVEIGARVLVIGATRESLSRLGELTGAEEIAALRSRCGVSTPDAGSTRPALPAPAPVAEEKPGGAYDGVIEELSRIRTTVRDWTRQEVAP